MSEKLLTITILSDKSSWMNAYNLLLKEKLEKAGHGVRLIHSKEDLQKGDIAFFLSCFEIVGKKFLELHKNNLVVHASDLPQGKGWSPATWQILEGKKEIPVTLFEADEKCDNGVHYLKDILQLNGSELIDEWQGKLGDKIVEMCIKYVKERCYIRALARQEEVESFYPRRKPEDSRLDVDKTIQEQFNMLRVADNDAYPAFFEMNGAKYILKIYKDTNNG